MRCLPKIFSDLLNKKSYPDLVLETRLTRREASTVLCYTAGTGTLLYAKPHTLPINNIKKLATRNVEMLKIAFDQDETRGKEALQRALMEWQYEENGRYQNDRKTASKMIEAAYTNKILKSRDFRELKFKNLNLGSTPTCLSKLRYVEKLTLEDCTLTEIKAFPPRMLELDINKIPNLLMPKLQEGLERLTMMRCDLTVVPELPESLQHLNVAYNCVERVGAADRPLPSNLVMLDANDNKLTELGALPQSLRSLNISNNRLRSIPTLPDNVEGLWIAHNLISRLPNIPTKLYLFAAAHNRLSDLPDELAYIENHFKVDLTHNPIPDSVFNRIIEKILAREDIKAISYGPSIYIDETPTSGSYFSVTSMTPDVPLPSGKHMPEAVLWWYHKIPDDYETKEKRKHNWHSINKKAKDPYGNNVSTSFGKFMVRLVETAEYKNPALNQQYKKRIIGLLDVLVTDKLLLNKCYLIAQDALGECQDRIALGLEKMHIEVLNTKAASGALDRQELLAHCMSQYKLEVLKNICAEKMKRQPELDEIEVYLYFQVKLANLLDLPVTTKEISYAYDAHIHDSEADAAVVRITEALRDENALADFMVQHSPWKTYLESNATPPLREAWLEREHQTKNIQTRMSAMMEQLHDIARLEGELSTNFLEKTREINNLNTKFDTFEADIDRPVLKEMTLVHLNQLKKLSALK